MTAHRFALALVLASFVVTVAAPSTAAVTSDTTPPSVPQELRGTSLDRRYVQLSWQASSDDRPGTIRYRVFRNNVRVASVTARQYLDRAPSVGRYEYKVRAVDVAGNKSAFTPPITVRAVRDASVDTVAPSVPTSVSAEPIGQRRIRLGWQPSSDDRAGAILYRILRDGLRIATVTDPTYVDSLPAETDNTYTVRAVDAAGNVSAHSASVTQRALVSIYPWAGKVYSSGSRVAARVALTFDDCYSVNNLRRIVSVLREYGAAATFFPVAEAVIPAPDLWADIATDFPIGNHTLTHPNLTRRTPEQIDYQISAARELIESTTGRPMLRVFRPPGGAYNADVVAAAKWHDLAVVRWDIDTRDWEKPSAELVTTRALEARNGSIILMHATYANTPEALPQIIEGLRARGFELVSLDEMLGIPWDTEPTN
jgi:peptidoglycan/xylan/chitin deacetylase (PgdA/CDA1 family)